MRAMIERGFVCLSVVLAAFGAGAGPALAHAERVASTPEDGAKRAQVPAEVSVSFTEPPIADANFQVLDGCGNDVVEDLDVQGTDITAALSGGQPGRWKVAFHVVSGIDGHATRDDFRFAVRGEADCEAEASPPPDATGPGEDDEEEDDGPMMLIALFVGVTVLTVLVALALRGRKS